LRHVARVDDPDSTLTAFTEKAQGSEGRNNRGKRELARRGRVAEGVPSGPEQGPGRSAHERRGAAE
jgi:hypothetical protein